jgi:hypothetical protein
MEQHKIELLSNAKPVKTKQGRWNPRYIAMVNLTSGWEQGSLNLWRQLTGFVL